MDWLARVLTELAASKTWGYQRGVGSTSEPAALAALALTFGGDPDAAKRPLNWLRELQSQDGSIGVSAAQREPRWPTAWALAAWTGYGVVADPDWYQSAAQRAAAALLQISGQTLKKSSEFGHDCSLVGWPWAEHTHSWIEPTALAVTALKHSGHVDHPRVREGVLLLIDRLLPTGGCNYGNSIVLGQTLRPHVQPTGICLLALQNEEDPSGRVSRSIGWLARQIGPRSTPLSLAYALMGLAAHGHAPGSSDDLLAPAALRELSSDRRPYCLALLACAAHLCRAEPRVLHPISGNTDG
jgi:hypothetical protein